MSNTNRVLIELSNGKRLDYLSELSLGIKLSRVADDFVDPSKRYGEFSMTFDVPKTKNNDAIFDYPDVKGRFNVFAGKTFECNAYDNNQIMIAGILELVGVSEDAYQVRFYSKITQFIDDIKDKKLNEMTYLPTIPWQYEVSIINHIKVAPLSEHIEFPMSFYRTPFISGGTKVVAKSSRAEANLGFVYNYFIAGSSNPYNEINPMYEAAFPPAIYLKSIVDGIFADAGWTYNSSFFNRADIQTIIIPFTGKGEDFTGSVIDNVSGDTLNLNKLLPAMNQAEFLKTIINVFNLYLIPDVANKSMVIETYNTLFTDNSNPYPIRLFNKKKESRDTQCKISTKSDSTNDLPLGFNRILDYANVADPSNINPTFFLNTCIDIRDRIGRVRLTGTYNKETYDNLWNKTTGTKDIKLNLSPTNYYPYTLVNDRSIFNSTTTAQPYWTIGLPLISPQTPQNNDGKDFAEDAEQNYIEGNDPNNWSYDGGLKLLYYYGPAKYNVSPDSGLTSYKDWLWVAIATGGTVTIPTFVRVPVCIASPYRLLDTERFDYLMANINTLVSESERFGERGAEVHGILLTYFGAGTSTDTHDDNSFSLTFGEDPLYDNIYTIFHRKKYEDFAKGELVTGTVRLNENDWREMQINRALVFDGELYKLNAITNYSPIERIAEISIIKKV